MVCIGDDCPRKPTVGRDRRERCGARSASEPRKVATPAPYPWNSAAYIPRVGGRGCALKKTTLFTKTARLLGAKCALMETLIIFTSIIESGQIFRIEAFIAN